MSNLQYTGIANAQAQIDKIIAKYDSMITSRVNTVPIMEEIGGYIQGLIKGNFESEGRRKGGSWPALKPDTIKHKLRLVGGAGGHRLQRGSPFGGGFFIRGAGGISGVFRPDSGPKHVFEPVRLTDTLFDAATGNTAHSVREIGPDRAVIGVRGIVYAGLQRLGGHHNVPGRDYMMIDRVDKLTILRLVEDYIFQAYAGGPNRRRPKGLGGYVF